MHRNKNEYYYSGHGLWVRNFTKKNVVAIDINDLISSQDMTIMLNNENNNYNKMLQRIDTESFIHEKIVIISDGYNFKERHKILEKLPAEIAVIGVNEALSTWECNKKMDYYVVNNPYEECRQLLPKQQKTFPKCVASTRTLSDFVDIFPGITFTYSPVPATNYLGQKSEADYFIDDYRNAVCAAVGLSYKFGVKKLLLLCCDEVYDSYRPATEKLANHFWMYPQQKIAHDLVDGNLFWLKKANIKTGYCSDGPEYKNAGYIAEDSIAKFFAE